MKPAPVAVHRFGNPRGAPLVLVHGLSEDGLTWPDAVQRWSDWDIHAVDQRGHGHSARFTADDVEQSHRIWVDDLHAVVGGLGRPAVIVGHSLGGLVALRLAVRKPEWVRALVLEDPAQPAAAVGPDPGFVSELRSFLAAFPEHAASEIDRMRRDTSWSEAEIRAWAESKARVDPLMIERGLFLGDSQWEALFQQLAVPTLLVLPEDGGMGPDPSAYRNPLVERVVIAGTGHCVRRDQPAAFHEAVGAFLGRC